MKSITASYLYFSFDDPVDRTIEIGPDILVDLSPSGYIVGIEKIGGPVSDDVLRRVLAKVKIDV